MSRRYWFFVFFVLFSGVAAVGWIDPVYELNEEGIRLYEAEKYREAAGKFSSVKRMTDETAVAHFNMGNAYYRQGGYDSAMREYFLAARSADKKLKANVYFNLGNCQYYRGDLEKALHYFRKTMKLNRDDEDARVNYEFVLSKLGKGGPAAGNGSDGPDNIIDVGEIPVLTDPQKHFIDEKDRQVIYDMLEAEERSKRKKVRFDDSLHGDEGGRNW